MNTSSVGSTSNTGATSNIGQLRRVAMRRPGAILSADSTRWHYGKDLDANVLQSQYEAFVGLVADSGAEIEWIDEADDDDLADSIFTYDPSFMFADGAVLLRPGKSLRLGEVELHETLYRRAGVDVIGRIEAPGVAEGGDMFWLDNTTLAVGRGFRTNQSGIDQLAAIAEPRGIAVEAYDLPYFKGPEACLHLMSVVSPLDADLALVHPPLMPSALYERMVQMGYQLLEAPADEFEASVGLNLNVLATAPRKVIAIEGFEGTHALMRNAGCEVQVFAADELCIPCEGGPTCMTRPILRG